MNISETCIRRPVMTTLITASLIVFGIFGYRLLAVAALPRVDFPTIQVTAVLPGASPETMAASVAGPIERQFSTIPRITSLTSHSSLVQRPGAGVPLTEIRGPRPGRSSGGGSAQHLARRYPDRADQGELQHAGRHALRRRPHRDLARLRRDAPRCGLPARRRGLAQRRP